MTCDKVNKALIAHTTPNTVVAVITAGAAAVVVTVALAGEIQTLGQHTKQLALYGEKKAR